MIQINLLPDVKLQYLKAQRNKRFVISLSLIISLAFAAVAILLALHVYVNQSLHTKGLNEDIETLLTEYQSIDGLETTLTVREQLIALPILHSDKPAVTRLPAFLTKIVPERIKLSELSLDFTSETFRISGRGEDTIDVNKFADILKNTYYSNGDGGLPQLVFSNVEFEIGVDAGDKEELSYAASMNFDTSIFDIDSKNVELTVPDIISTQSAIRSGPLFEAPPEVEEEEQ